MTDTSTKEKLLAAAGPIFARSGFKSATVREICAAADVNVASVNYYFGDKRQLYLETVIAARNRRVESYPRPEWNSARPAKDKLHEFVLMLLNRLVAMQSETWEVRLLMRELLEPTEACERLIEEYFRPSFEQLLLLVDELSPQPLARADRHRIGFSILGQILYYRYAASVTRVFLGPEAGSDNYSPSAIARHITEFSLVAIRGTTVGTAACPQPSPAVSPETTSPPSNIQA